MLRICSAFIHEFAHQWYIGEPLKYLIKWFADSQSVCEGDDLCTQEEPQHSVYSTLPECEDAAEELGELGLLTD